MADRERKEQEAWDREKKRRGKEYESDKQERRDRERWERQEEKKRTEENRHHKKDKKRKNDSDFERQRKWKFDLLNREEKVTDSRNQKGAADHRSAAPFNNKPI